MRIRGRIWNASASVVVAGRLTSPHFQNIYESVPWVPLVTIYHGLFTCCFAYDVCVCVANKFDWLID